MSKKTGLRGFTSILLSFAFLVVVTSGIVLWLSHSPQTFGLGKGAWKHMHIFVSLLMTVAGILHLVLNWRVYWSYLWERTARRMNQKWAFSLALLTVVAVAATAALDDHGGPLGRIDASMSLRQIAQRANVSVDQVVAALEKEKIAVHNAADSLKEIAEHNKLAADAVCAAVQKQLPAGRIGPPRGE